jgi:hypothetical protein
MISYKVYIFIGRANIRCNIKKRAIREDHIKASIPHSSTLLHRQTTPSSTDSTIRPSRAAALPCLLACYYYFFYFLLMARKMSNF